MTAYSICIGKAMQDNLRNMLNRKVKTIQKCLITFLLNTYTVHSGYKSPKLRKLGHLVLYSKNYCRMSSTLSDILISRFFHIDYYSLTSYGQKILMLYVYTMYSSHNFCRLQRSVSRHLQEWHLKQLKCTMRTKLRCPKFRMTCTYLNFRKFQYLLLKMKLMTSHHQKSLVWILFLLTMPILFMNLQESCIRNYR